MMKRTSVILTLLVLILSGLTVAQEGSTPYGDLLAAARAYGRTPVIVELRVNTPVQDFSALTPTLAAAQQVSIQQARTQLVTRLNLSIVPGLVQYNYLPYLALQADEPLLRQLIESDQVAAIYQDIAYELTLDNSSPLIGAEAAWGAGYDGSGQMVAILDSGVQAGHPFFGGRVTIEACFSFAGQFGGQTYTSNCPNGMATQFGAGAAAPCSGAGCDHGTHVAGIAAGSNASFSGVARNATIIGVQVSSNTPGCGGFLQPSCGTPILSRVVAAMEWVYQLKQDNPSYNIAAVNLSLGTPNVFTKTCDNIYKPQTDAVSLLRSAGIVTIAGTGNGDPMGQGYTSGISLPSCMTNVVSVGSTSADPGTVDQISTFSNSASFIDLLAPGFAINSSVPGGGYASFNGTSMATPQVTGAWALLRQAAPNASIEQILAALKSTGVPITDSRNGVTAPRIQVNTAINALTGGTYAPLYDVVINEIRSETQQAVELYNAGSIPAVLTGWHLQILAADGSIERDYEFANGYTIPAGAYRVVQRGSGAAANTLYMGTYTTTWGASGAVRLTNGTFAVDFMRWGSASVAPGIGTGWTGTNPPAPASGQTLGRDSLSTDFDDATDWTSMSPTLNAVNQVTRPANDDFASATVINTLPFSDTLNNRNATLQTQEGTTLQPDCSPSIGHTVWYRYTASSAGTLRISTRGSDFDTALAVWTDILTTPQQVACSEDIVLGTLPQSEVVISAAAGQTYYIQVGGYDLDAGLLQFEIVEGEANDSRAGAKVISTLPYSDQMNTDLSSAAQDDPQPACNTDPVANSVWYRFTPSVNTLIVASTAGSDFDTVLSLWADNGGTLSPVACHDDVNFFLLDFTSRIQATLTASTTYYFMISGGAVGYTGNLNFTVNAEVAAAPTLTSPANGATTADNTPLFVWQTVSGATTYQIQIDDQNNFSSPAQDVTQAGTSYTASTLANGTYYWRVRGRSTVNDGPWSATRSLTIDTATPPPVPTLTTPADNSTTANRRPTFTWQASSGAARYEIQISRSSPPAGTPVSVSGTSYQPPAALLTTGYYWRVRAINDADIASAWSPARLVTITSPAGTAPTLNLFTSASITLAWGDITWAAGYHVQIDNDSDFSSPVYDNDQLPAVPTVSPPPLTNGTYHWRVRARQSNGRWSVWSSPASFTVQNE